MKSVTLVCDESQLRNQWKEDSSCPWRTDEWLNISIRSLEFFQSREDSINISGKTVNDVVDVIMHDDI